MKRLIRAASREIESSFGMLDICTPTTTFAHHFWKVHRLLSHVPAVGRVSEIWSINSYRFALVSEVCYNGTIDQNNTYAPMPPMRLKNTKAQITKQKK